MAQDVKSKINDEDENTAPTTKEELLKSIKAFTRWFTEVELTRIKESYTSPFHSGTPVSFSSRFSGKKGLPPNITIKL